MSGSKQYIPHKEKEWEDNHDLSTMTYFGVTTTQRGGPGDIFHTQMSAEIKIVPVASLKHLIQFRIG